MGKAEKVHFSIAIMLSDMEMPLTFTSMNFRGQGHFVTLTKGHLSVVCLHFLRTSPLKLLCQFQLNVICSL